MYVLKQYERIGEVCVISDSRNNTLASQEGEKRKVMQEEKKNKIVRRGRRESSFGG